MISNARAFSLLVLLLCSCGGSVDNAGGDGLGGTLGGASSVSLVSSGAGGIAATSRPETQGGVFGTSSWDGSAGLGQGGLGIAGATGNAGAYGVSSSGNAGARFGSGAPLGGTAGNGSLVGIAGTIGTSMQCRWEDIVCGSLSPTCADGQAYIHVAACSGPCVSTSLCSASWSPDQDVLTVGAWLIGWHDDLPHYSLLRFSVDGGLEFAAPSGMPTNQPYFACTGIGDWAPLQVQGTIHIGFPSGCSDKSTGIRFESFYGAEGRWGAAMRAVLRGGAPIAVEAFWFPTGRCDDSGADCPI